MNVVGQTDVRTVAMKYRHKKTGRIYRWIAAGTDCTNGYQVAVYCPEDNERAVYVRKKDDFEEKFDPITTVA